MAEPLIPKTPSPTPEPKPGDGTDIAALVAEAVKSQFDEFSKKVDERFEGLSKKTQERFAALEGSKSKKDDKEPATDPKASKGDLDVESITASVRAELKLDAAMKGLDEKARERVESIKAEHGVAAALALAEGLGSISTPPATDGGTGASPKNGDAATQSPPTAQRFDSYDDWQSFKKNDPNAAMDYKRSHRSFDPFKLKGAPRRTWERDEDPPAAADVQAGAAQ
ncbi:MAG: hypothetical protein RMA76_38175 [Deltaproteobacteria bacterium]|jgi:hypothetical protein